MKTKITIEMRNGDVFESMPLDFNEESESLVASLVGGTMPGMQPYRTPAEKTWYWIQIAAAIIPFIALAGMLGLIAAGVILL